MYTFYNNCVPIAYWKKVFIFWPKRKISVSCHTKCRSSIKSWFLLVNERERERERKRKCKRVTVYTPVNHFDSSHSYVEETCASKFSVSYYDVKAERLYHVKIGCNFHTGYLLSIIWHIWHIYDIFDTYDIIGI